MSDFQFADQVITLNQAAKLLCVSYSTALRLARAGKLPAFKATSKSWRTTTAACRDFIKRRFGEQLNASADNGTFGDDNALC